METIGRVKNMTGVANEGGGLAIWKEAEPQGFDFSGLKKNTKCITIMGVSVCVDRVMYDITGETCIGISGTFVMRGVKVRAVWDALGNVVEFQKTGIMFGWREAFGRMFEGCEDSMFRLVTYKELENGKTESNE